MDRAAKLTAGDAAAGDSFGFAVSVSGDTAVIGAYRDDDAGSNSGSAYVFLRSGSSWTQPKLTASDAAAGDEFGHSVSVSGDTAIIGAPGDDDAASNSGSAYAFVLSGGMWTQQDKLTAGDGAENDEYGFSVSYLMTLQSLAPIAMMMPVQRVGQLMCIRVAAVVGLSRSN